ncbi:MAG: ribonuclease T2-like [Phylliscum demangeonii]|nr:MAG: ribonuclease T2-like [Phylliscum demangeonii]
MSSTSAIKAVAVALALAAAFQPGARAGTPPSCPNAPLSCHGTGSGAGAAAASCCFLSPGGQLLQTQFWDTNPPTGPEDSWTLHGLWPDHCDGTFDTYCDKSRAYTDIGGTVGGAQPELLAFMQTYWKDYQGDDENLWEHEWSKHGTCINTLKPSCYAHYGPQEELVDYFQKAVDLFKGLDTYQALAAAGITPSTQQRYTAQRLQTALSQVTGHSVTLGCKNGVLNEVWYHFNVRGSLQTGDFVPTEPDGPKSTCPAKGIRYLPKSGTQAAGGRVLTGAPSPFLLG